MLFVNVVIPGRMERGMILLNKKYKRDVAMSAVEILTESSLKIVYP